MTEPTVIDEILTDLGLPIPPAGTGSPPRPAPKAYLHGPLHLSTTADRTIFREFKGIKVKDNLTIGLSPSSKVPLCEPILCGVEVTVEQQ